MFDIYSIQKDHQIDWLSLSVQVRAEALVFKTAVSVMSSGTDIFAIANACLSIRESYKTLEQCQKILKLKKWDSEELKYEFENGIKFGLGK